MGKLPDFDDWKWPWTEGDVDEKKLARLVYNLKKDVQDRDEKVSAKDQEIQTLKTDLTAAQEAKSGLEGEAAQELVELRTKVRKLEADGEKARPADQKRIDQLEVALDLGLSLADSKRLVGETRDEILADAKIFAKEHGIDIEGEDDGENEGGDDDGGNAGFGSNTPVLNGRGSVPQLRGKAPSLVDPSTLDLPPLS